MNYQLSYSLAGFVFLLILTVYFLYRPIFPNPSNRRFRLILIVSLISVGMDLLTAHTINHSEQISTSLNYLFNIIYFSSLWLLPVIFLQYIFILTKKPKYRSSKLNLALVASYVIQVAAIVSTPLTKFIIYFDSSNVYHHGSLYTIFVGYNIALLLLSAIFVITNGNEMPKEQRIIVITYVFLLLGANLVQTLNPEVLLSGFALAAASFLMFFTLQNPASYYDSLTNNYSRTTLHEYIEMLVSQNVHFQFIIVDIKGTTAINKTLGEEIGTDIISIVGKKVLASSGLNLSFRMDGDQFIIITQTIKERDLTIEVLKKQFPFKYHYSDYYFDVNVHLNYTDTIYDFEDQNEATEIIKECTLVSKTSSLSLINKGSLDAIKKNRKIEKALRNCIENQDILIYLQPIFSSKTKKCVKAEALIRLYDCELGIIMPDEFIQLAESNGSITKLAPLIIEKVCKFLSSTKLPKSFKNISINLSVIDCMNPNLDTLILDILKKYNIKNNQISFEITETVASLVPALEKNMFILRKEGIAFALDDFGSGFANIDTVVKLPFDIIKIDRQLLLLMDDPKYNILLKSLIEIFLALDLEIVVEGIENNKQSKFVEDIGATYQQGYLYAPPLSMEDFTDLIKED